MRAVLAIIAAAVAALAAAAPAPVAFRSLPEGVLAAAPRSLDFIEVSDGPQRRAVDINNNDRDAVRAFYMNQYRPTMGMFVRRE